MAFVGGSIESLVLSGREFGVATDADSNRKLGGFENEIQANGNGTARLIKTRMNWKLDGLTVSVDDDKGDHEFLQELSDRNDFFAIAITYASGEVYQGSGSIIDELQTSSQNALASFALSGPGVLTKQ